MIGELNETEQQQQQQPYQPKERYEYKHRIYPITEGIPSPYTQKAYQRSLERFLDFVKIHDLQVLLDFSPKAIKQMIVDYILYLRQCCRPGSIPVYSILDVPIDSPILWVD